MMTFDKQTVVFLPRHLLLELIRPRCATADLAGSLADTGAELLVLVVVVAPVLVAMQERIVRLELQGQQHLTYSFFGFRT